MDLAVNQKIISFTTQDDFITRLKRQDEKAFQELVKKESPKMYSICLQYLADTQAAEDLVQEIFIKIFESIESFNEQAKLSTWIHRITVNACLEEVRRLKAKKRSFFSKALARSDDEQEYWNESLTEGQSIDQNLEQKAHTKALYQAIYQLPDEQQTAFVLHNLQEMSTKEVAEIMEKTVPSVEGLLHRAKARMKELLYDYYKENIG